MITRCLPPLSRTLFTNTSSCNAVDVDDGLSSAHSRADSLFKMRRHFNLFYKGLSATKRGGAGAESAPRSARTPEAVSDPSVECSLAAAATANALRAIGAKDVADVDGVSSRIPASVLHEPALIMFKKQCARVASDDWTNVKNVHGTVNS